MTEMSVQLVTVERLLWSGKASMVVAQTTEGELGVQHGHEALLGELVEGGVVRIIDTKGDTEVVAVHGGFLSVTDDGVSILAEDAEFAHEIDIEQARRELAAADEDAAEKARATGRIRAAEQSV